METTHLLTLVAADDRAAAESSIPGRVVEALRAGGADVGSALRFDDGAWDLPFGGLAGAEAVTLAEAALGDYAVDAAVQRSDAGRRKRLLVADMDRTIVTVETIDELAAHAGKGGEVAAITAQAMAGTLDFAGALRARVALLRGLPATAVAEVARALTLMPGAATLVATMKAHGAATLLVSGGFDVFAARAAALAGFDEHQANHLGLAGGRLTGAVGEPILGREAKLAALRGGAKALGVGLEATCAVGDGANDLAMVAAAGLGVAYHAKPVVAAAALARVRHGTLATLLSFQGYRKHEFCTG